MSADVTGFFMSLVETKPLMIAAVAGTGAVFLLGDNFDSALQFGAIGALGASLGDFVMNFMGWSTSVQSYFAAEFAYMDPADAIGAAGGSALLLYSLGGTGSQLLKEVAVIGVAGLFAPKIAGLFGSGALQKMGPGQQHKNAPLVPKMGGPKIPVLGPAQGPPQVPVMGPFGPGSTGPVGVGLGQYGPNSTGPVMFGNPFLTQPPLAAVSVK